MTLNNNKLIINTNHEIKLTYKKKQTMNTTNNIRQPYKEKVIT